jgi:hypothetical protein
VSRDWLWSHKDYLGFTAPLSGLRFPRYALNAGRWYDAQRFPHELDISRVGVITHELLHFFGLSDLYDTTHATLGVGMYCVLGVGWGPDWSCLYPGSLSAPARLAMGWLEVQDLDALVPEYVKAHPERAFYEVNLTLPPVQRAGKALRLRVSSAQYFVVENRASEGFDAGRPGGALVWHVDETLRLRWADKPPNDAPVLPGLKHTWAARHYGVRLVQPDRSYALERTHAKWGDKGLVSRGAYFGWDPAAQLGSSAAVSDALFALASYADMERGKYGFARICCFRLHDVAIDDAAGTARSTGDISLTFSYGTPEGERGAPFRTKLLAVLCVALLLPLCVILLRRAFAGLRSRATYDAIELAEPTAAAQGAARHEVDEAVNT